TDGGHDERFTDRTGDLVDRRLTRKTDGDKGVIDAPHRAEQSDERRNRTDRSEEGDAALQLGVDFFELAVQRHGDPVVEVHKARALTGGSADAAFSQC